MALTNAEKQARFRERHQVLVGQVAALLAELANACERGGCHHLADNLPDEPAAALQILTERLTHYKLIGADKREKRRMARKWKPIQRQDGQAEEVSLFSTAVVLTRSEYDTLKRAARRAGRPIRDYLRDRAADAMFNTIEAHWEGERTR